MTATHAGESSFPAVVASRRIHLTFRLIRQGENLQIRLAEDFSVTRALGKGRDELDAGGFGRAHRDEGEERGLDAGAGGSVVNLGHNGEEDVELLCAGAGGYRLEGRP